MCVRLRRQGGEDSEDMILGDLGEGPQLVANPELAQQVIGLADMEAAGEPDDPGGATEVVAQL